MRIDPSAHDSTWTGFAANQGTTGNLLNILDSLAAAESLPADVIYVCIYPGGVNQSNFAGWAVGRWIISSSDGVTFAHEILHKTGSPQHAPCGRPANVDPGYPDYPTFSAFPAASMPAPSTPPFRLPDDRQVPVSFVKLRERWVVVDLPGFPQPLPPRPPGPRDTPVPRRALEAVVRDQAGAELFRGPVSITSNSERSDVTIPDLIHAEVPWLDRAGSVELGHGNEVLVSVPVEDIPSLEVAFPPGRELAQGRGLLSYRATTKSGRVAVAVRASRDRGASWSAVVVRETRGSVDLGALLDAPGDGCLLEVLATSGYHTAVQRSEPFRLRPGAR